MSDYLTNVAIIGAGLGGCALALALSNHNIPTTLYESRPANTDLITSGVVLTPNGLWVLDQLGVFSRIKDKCYTTTHRIFKNDRDETTRKVLVTHERLYGYRNHRVWRKVLLEEMKAMCREAGVVIRYGAKFEGFVREDETEGEGVEFLINGRKEKASMVVGADGIYSSVRGFVAPGVVPEYTGTVGVLGHIRRDSVAWPYEDYEANATIQGKPGAIFWIAEDPKAEDIMIGTQVSYPEQSRRDLERLQHDKDKLVEFYRRGYDEHGATARSIIDSVTENKETLFIWPYLKMPKLPQWYSKSGRVVIVGDGAHALPPSSGQGVNQALEDVYSLAKLLSSINDHCSAATNGASITLDDSELVVETLAFWQEMRQKRIDAIFNWVVNSQNVSRLPEEDRKRLVAEGKASDGDDMSWLYRPTLEEDMDVWLRRR